MSETLPGGSLRQRGFTLVEVAVSLFVTVIILLGVLALFDFSNKLARAQTNVSDMQQSLRVAQTDAIAMIRMAGRGGLPLGTLPGGGFAVDVSDNVPEPTYIGGAGKTDTPEVVPGTDVLTVRGVFSSPIYQVNTADPAAFTLSPAGAPIGGTILISSTTPTGIPQDLTALSDAIAKKRHEALLLVSPRSADVWAVVELDPSPDSTSTATQATVKFHITGGTHTDSYKVFSSSGPGIFPPDLTNAAYVGILEEHRFYVRRVFSVPGVKTSDLTPKLARARVYPGTNVPWGDDAGNLQLDIADNVFDFQVTLGFDNKLTADEVNGALAETTDGEGDDWMYNGEKAPAQPAGDLRYVRLSTLARTDRRDHSYVAPLLDRVEDHVYPADSPFNGENELQYRRRILRTVIDLRNL
ncbi:MAG TPA: prepilin-type N-terminal cleavage/methylation domain-containing protein [Thermoanaerobaculia bacterium]|jgi:type II secretory pathway pseudopilin PulG|nr:prepilin-type N-terminal cleavage/methylation domain-containing protein [Thermoanaerobaculia bacterium]